MDRGNKLWEGHRMMNPEMREAIHEFKKELVPKPLLSEDYLDEIGQRLRHAKDFQRTLLLTYHTGETIQELMVFSFRIQDSVLECNFENGCKRKIGFSQIVDVEII